MLAELTEASRTAAGQRYAAATREDSLIQRAKKGDPQAFNELVLEHQDAVYRQAYWITGQKEAAEDAAQEAFFLAYQKLHTFRGGSFRAWIVAIALHASIDQYRRTGKHALISLDAFEENESAPTWSHHQSGTPEQMLEESCRRSAILQALMQLPMEARMPIILIDIQEFDYQTAAHMLRIPLGTLKSRLVRARLRLLETCRQFPEAN